MKRRGFGLIQALIVIVLISGLMVIAMKYANISTKQTADLYVKERAALFMDEAVEMTLLAISGYDRVANNDCFKSLHVSSEDSRFVADINVTKYFLYGGGDNAGPWYANCSDRNVSILTEDSHGMVMLEVIVETNATHPKNLNKDIRLTRRTLQRP